MAGRPRRSDLFGVKDRRWLAVQELPDHERPAALRDKIRRLELLTAAEPRQGKRVGARIKVTPQPREAERELARQAEIAYRRLVTDWTAQGKVVRVSEGT